MAGRGTISVSQAPQHGDKTALDSASKALTETPMTGNPTPAPSAGRPSTGGVSQTGNTVVPGNMPNAHIEAADDVARKAWAAKFWAELASRPDAGPRTQMYARKAADALEASAASARNRTPYFEA